MSAVKATRQKLWLATASSVITAVITGGVAALMERGIFGAAILAVTISMGMASTVVAAHTFYTLYYRRSDAHARANPPAIAEWLIILIISKRRAESFLGDMEERFRRHVEARGLRRARWLYWAEVLKSILPILWAKARSLGLIAASAEIWRRTHS